MRFGIRDVLWLTAVVACLTCWYLERDGRLVTAKRYVQSFEENKRLKADLEAAQTAQVTAERELRDLSADRLEKLQKLVEELRSETSNPESLSPRQRQKLVDELRSETSK